MGARFVLSVLVLAAGLGCSGTKKPGPGAGGEGASASGAAATGASGGQGGTGGTGGAGGTSAPSVDTDAGTAAVDGGSDGSTGTPPNAASCAARAVAGDAVMHFHHIHFNTADPSADLEFFEEFLNAPAVEFCSDPQGGVTRATKTERGYFLYTQVPEPPDPTLNTYLEHVGWLHQSPTEELLRLVALGVTLWPEGRAQCAEAAAGAMACSVLGVLPDYFFYLQAPSGARIEVARGPGPAMMGFGHIHMIQGDDLAFYETVSGGAFVVGGAIDMVNHTDSALTEDRLATEMVVDTRGKPIDHFAYSTTDLVAARDRIAAAGITIEDDIAFRPAFGFESFFVRSPKGIWVEIVADTPFAP